MLAINDKLFKSVSWLRHVQHQPALSQLIRLIQCKAKVKEVTKLQVIQIHELIENWTSAYSNPADLTNTAPLLHYFLGNYAVKEYMHRRNRRFFRLWTAKADWNE